MSEDHHGKEWTLRITKYWDNDAQEVVYSATKPREEPIELRKVLGYYEWVYDAYEGEDREIEPASGSRGYLELTEDKTKMKAANKTKGKGGKGKGKGTASVAECDIDPDHVKGKFETSGISRSFVGLSENDDSKCSWTFGGNWDESEFCIGVVDVEDDNGHPFIVFTHSLGADTDYDVSFIGKKQQTPKKLKTSPKEGLTDGERQRLGIFVEEEEIKRAVLGLKSGLGSAGSTPANDRLEDEDDGEDEVEGKDDGDGDKEVNFGSLKRKAQDSPPDGNEPPCKK
ncbi:hypothetical protein B0H14DRAFT_3469949 [Mycena olivaceomarginata]|nr:hypothetical protein B0H14DRAFT_3469949 [Mycena olivaceomarginata]